MHGVLEVTGDAKGSRAFDDRESTGDLRWILAPYLIVVDRDRRLQRARDRAAARRGLVVNVAARQRALSPSGT